MVKIFYLKWRSYSLNGKKELIWEKLAEKYEIFWLDLWGVLIDGTQCFPYARDFLRFLRKTNKQVIFMSNTPTLRSILAAELNHIGIDASLYDYIMTSGEAARNYLERTRTPLLNSYFHIGDEKHAHLLEGLHFTQANSLENANFILLTAFDPLFASVLQLNYLKSLNKEMICVNPDRFIITLEGEKKYCAGELAKLFEERGGKVTFVGKPFPLIFSETLKCLSQASDKSQIIMIGDNLMTDIRGAKNFGIDSALVNNSEITTDLPNYVFPSFTI